jgi:predicted Zn-dependent protease
VKRWIIFTAILALLIGALVLSQTRHVDAAVAPNALLYFVADTERELTRLPMKYTRISDADEIKYGNAIANWIANSSQDEEGQVVEAYLRSVGERVAANAHRKLPYKFHYLPERDFINAFAIPGGHVFVGAGLLAFMENEDELAAVLGHEIEHIDHYHCAERLQIEAALKKVPLGALIDVPVQVFEAGYTKDQELEADREGTRLAVAAGYSPDGAIELFGEFKKMEEQLERKGRTATPEEEISGAAVQILTGYFRSHPASSDRMALTRSLIAEEGWTPRPEKPLGVRYIYLSHRAEDLVASAKYGKAVETASQALQLHPGYPPALVALAKAACATRDFTKAATAYRELLARHQAQADSVRAFADDQGTAAMSARHFDDAGRLAAFSLDLQPNNAGSLKLLAEVKLEQNDAAAALEIAHKLQTLYPSAASSLKDYAYNASEQAFQLRDYARAGRFAAFTLELTPGRQADMRSVLARSEFALANFRAAADDYRKLIGFSLRTETTIEPAVLDAYADALGSVSQHTEAAREFASALQPSPAAGSDFNVQVRIEEAGLMIVAGSESQARSLSERSSPFAPERAARLGWWYYRAGKFDAAAKILQRFIAERPGDSELQTTLGWVEIETDVTKETGQRFLGALGDVNTERAARAGMAIVNWRLKRSEDRPGLYESKAGDDILRAFDQVSKDSPEWTNPAWVRALYGPVAARSAQEMHTELQKRIAAKWR